MTEVRREARIVDYGALIDWMRATHPDDLITVIPKHMKPVILTWALGGEAIPGVVVEEIRPAGARCEQCGSAS